jgi:hypothetical protein
MKKAKTVGTPTRVSWKRESREKELQPMEQAQAFYQDFGSGMISK